MISITKEPSILYTTNEQNGSKLVCAITDMRTPARLCRCMTQRGVDVYPATNSPLFYLGEVAAFYQSPREHGFRIAPAEELDWIISQGALVFFDACTIIKPLYHRALLKGKRLWKAAGEQRAG